MTAFEASFGFNLWKLTNPLKLIFGAGLTSAALAIAGHGFGIV